MKTKHQITNDELGELCFWFHKLTRISDDTKNGDLWNAINNLPDDRDKQGLSNYARLMRDALDTIGIKVVDKIAPRTTKVKRDATKDELYTNWSTCLTCGCTTITDGDKYCPKCGRNIDWSGVDCSNIPSESIERGV